MIITVYGEEGKLLLKLLEKYGSDTDTQLQSRCC